MGHIPSIITLGYPRRRTMHVTQLIREVFDYHTTGVSKAHPVEGYLRVLCKTCDGDRSRLDDLKECKVVKLELRKCPNPWAHEFVLAFVEHTSIDNTTQQEVTQSRVFMIERDSDPNTTSQLSNATGLVKTKSASDRVPANDIMQIYENSDDALKAMNGTLCYTVHFTANSTQPNILDLVAAACGLTQSAPYYTLFRHMCYWYANGLCRVLAQGRTYVIAKENDLAGRWRNTMLIDRLGKMILRDTLPEFEKVTPAALEEMANDESSIFSLPSNNSNDPALGISTHHFLNSDPVVAYHVKYQGCLVDAEGMIRVAEDQRNGKLAKAERQVKERDQRIEELERQLAEAKKGK
ncbi:hypothetical protein QCA50_004130 [Cerrena zonata]|uniref:Uncharacterized protein n=1 Tax=Cerrena zonata TaxID=2478898 RepID=A0AAW0GG17_9APHY